MDQLDGVSRLLYTTAEALRRGRSRRVVTLRHAAKDEWAQWLAWTKSTAWARRQALAGRHAFEGEGGLAEHILHTLDRIVEIGWDSCCCSCPPLVPPSRHSSLAAHLSPFVSSCCLSRPLSPSFPLPLCEDASCASPHASSPWRGAHAVRFGRFVSCDAYAEEFGRRDAYAEEPLIEDG